MPLYLLSLLELPRSIVKAIVAIMKVFYEVEQRRSEVDSGKLAINFWTIDCKRTWTAAITNNE